MLLGNGNQSFAEVYGNYHRDELIAEMRRIRQSSHRPGRIKWVQGLIDAVTKSRDPRRGAICWENDGPIVQPTGAPHHATSH